MAKRIYNGECLIRCDHCGAVNTAEWKGLPGLKKWKIKNCTKCNKKIDVKKMQTVLCPHCNTLVEKDPNNLCLKCGQFIYRDDEVFPAECNNCGIINLIPLKHDEDVYCYICGEKFPKDKLTPHISPNKLVPQNIKLKDQDAMLKEDLIVWKHPQHQFAVNSRLQVNAGTWALLLQNGICQEPFGPGSYLLEETGLKQKDKLDAAAKGEDVVLDTEIFCVLEKLPELNWGTPGQPGVLIQNNDGTRDYRILANGTLTWKIADPKAFVSHFGFMELKGKEGLLKINPEPMSEDAELVRDTRNAVCDALRKISKSLVNLENLDPLKLPYKETDIEKQMYAELARIMDRFGLIVHSLRLREYSVQEVKNPKTEIREFITRIAQKDYQWNAEGVKLSPGTDKTVFADYAFTGDARLKITDKDAFFSVSEIQSLSDTSIPITDNLRQQVEKFFSTKLDDAISASVAPAAQSIIAEGRINVQDLNLHTPELAESIRKQVQNRLSPLGLEVETLQLIKLSFTKSEALKREEEMESRKKALIRYAEKPIHWDARSIDIHMKDDKALKASVQYSGTCTFKVKDSGRFFERSEFDGYLNTDPFVSEKAVNDYLSKQIVSHFTAKLAGITQGMIDMHDWDIRELTRYTEKLKESVTDTLDELVSGWGMGVESVYLDETKVNQSPELQKLGELETKKTLTDMEIAAVQLQDNKDVAVTQSHTNSASKKDDVQTDAYIHKNENERKRGAADEENEDFKTNQQIKQVYRGSQVNDAVHDVNMKQLANQAAEQVQVISGQRLVDEEQNKRDNARTEQGYSAEARKLQHESELDRAKQDAIHQVQVSEEEHNRVLAEIRQKAGIDEAKFHEVLNGIMHSIDASNLDWQKKLDEYARLSRQLGVQDTQEARRLEAETETEILKMQGKTKAEIFSMMSNAEYESGIKNIQLDKTQAELQETINRYAEERVERKAAADFARKEKDAILAFQQNLELRKQIAEEQMDVLKEKQADAEREREYGIRIAQMNAEIEKLRLELDAANRKVHEEAELGKAQSANEARAKEAEFKYLTEKEAERHAREDDMMNRAEALFRYVQDIEDGMKRARMSMEQHADDNDTSVRKAYADVEKAKASGLNDFQRSELLRKLDDLEKQVIRNNTGNNQVKFNNDEYDKLLKEIRHMLESIEKNTKSIDELRDKLKTVASTNSCWNCGITVKKTDLFCSNCGASLKPGTHRWKDDGQPEPGTKCPVCRTINAPGRVTCTNCGAPLV